MKLIRVLLALVISGGLVADCSKSVDSKSKSFSYPLALGNQWIYSAVQTQEHGNSTKVDTLWYSTDTVNLTVVQIDTVRPGVLSYTIRGTDVGWENPDSIPQRTYLNLAQGMYLLSMKDGISVNGGTLLPRPVSQLPGVISEDKPSVESPNFRWLAVAFPDPTGLIDCQTDDPADTLPLVLAYPQRTGLFWTYRDSTDAHPYRTDELIEGRETITTAAGTFDCWRIRKTFTPYRLAVDYVDYVSPEGLIRRRIDVHNLDEHAILTCDLISYTLR